MENGRTPNGKLILEDNGKLIGLTSHESGDGNIQWDSVTDIY